MGDGGCLLAWFLPLANPFPGNDALRRPVVSQPVFAGSSLRTGIAVRGPCYPALPLRADVPIICSAAMCRKKQVLEIKKCKRLQEDALLQPALILQPVCSFPLPLFRKFLRTRYALRHPDFFLLLLFPLQQRFVSQQSHRV